MLFRVCMLLRQHLRNGLRSHLELLGLFATVTKQENHVAPGPPTESVGMVHSIAGKPGLVSDNSDVG